MSTELTAVTRPRVHALDGVVHIQHLTTADPDVYSITAAAADPEAAVQRALSTGSRALHVAQASIDTTMVEESFAALTHALGQHIEQASTRVGTAASAVLNDPTSGIAASLLSWRHEMDALLDATFNPDRRGSAFGRLDQILTDATDQQLRATRKLLNPDVEDSPLARVLSAVRDQVGVVLDAVGRLSEQVAVDKATAAATAATLELTAIKGLAFEDQVAATVTGYAAARGDVAEAVGRLSGSLGACVGDIVVDLEPSTAATSGGRYVLECKDRRLSLRAVLAELGNAATNRDAHAAIAVFSHPKHSPVPDPFTVFDNRAIVVYDKDRPDPAALHLACTWGRWVAQRDSRPDIDRIDTELVRQLVDDARQVLARRTTIRRAHAVASKKIHEAAAHVDELHDNLSELIDRIERAITS